MLHCHATLKNAYFRFAAPVRHCKAKGLSLKRLVDLGRYRFRCKTVELRAILSSMALRACPKTAYFRFAAPVRHCKPKGLPLKRSMSLARYSFRRETAELRAILSCSMSRASTKLAFIRFAAPVAIAYPFSIKSRPRELAVAMFYARWFSLTAQILH